MADTYYIDDIRSVCPNLDSRILYAWNAFNLICVNGFGYNKFRVLVDPSFSSYGYFDAANQLITVKSENEYSIIRPLGNFIAFVTNNYDRSTAFSNIYSAEKSLYDVADYGYCTGTSYSYTTQNASEYFAESIVDYSLRPAALKAKRPRTYSAMETPLNTVTVTQMYRIAKIYGDYWD